MRRSIAILAAMTAAAVPATAGAAEPEAASVSAASPKVQWSGKVQNGILFHNTFYYEGTTAAVPGALPCQAPGCDTFTLENADGTADLNLELSSEQSPDISLRVQDPSGTWTYYNGWNDTSPVTKVRLKKAAKGTYVINVVIRRLGTTNPSAVDDTSDYKGVASLAVAPQAAAPAPAPQPQTAPAPQAGTQPAPAPAPANKPSAKAACQKKAKKIKNKRKRKAAMKRCAKKR
jgi:hypothetical protein